MQSTLQVYLEELPIGRDWGFLLSQVTDITYKRLKDQG